jgi:hypothetical protein
MSNPKTAAEEEMERVELIKSSIADIIKSTHDKSFKIHCMAKLNVSQESEIDDRIDHLFVRVMQKSRVKDDEQKSEQMSDFSALTQVKASCSSSSSNINCTNSANLKALDFKS